MNIKLTRVEIVRHRSHSVQETGLELGLTNQQQEVNLKQRRERDCFHCGEERENALSVPSLIS